jgi:anti-sigma B factor antagonist
MATTDTLTRKLDMVGSRPPAHVVIDLSGLQFLDSTGLYALITVHREWSSEERPFKLIRGPRAVQRVFELTETEALFEFED